MRYAVDRYRIGNETEVDADRFSGCFYIPDRRNRFYCPECGEIVYFRDQGGTHPSHFYHQEKTDKSPECDKRVDGRSELSLNERVGLPLYLVRIHGNTFQLNIGFPPLGKELLMRAVEAQYTVEISYRNNSQRIKVDNSQFIEDETTLIPLSFIPDAGKNYRITINGSRSVYGIYRKWSDYADGFEYGSAIFSYDETGGKKIKRGDSISTYRDYYAFTPYKIKDYPEIDYSDEGQVVIGNLVYKIYRIKLRLSVNNVERYRIVSSYIKRIFGVWVLECAPELIPLWPPVVEQEASIPISNKSNLLCAVSSGNDSPSVFVYSDRGTSKLNVKNNLGKCYVELNLGSKPALLSVDRKYVGREVTFVIKDIYRMKCEYNIQVILNDCPAKCESACHECLMHYWNQREHSKLDRFAALELLDWAHNSILPKPIDYDIQDELLQPLNYLGADYAIESDGEKHYIKSGNSRKRIIAYPSMWNEKSNLIPEGTIAVSDKLLKYALPKAEAMIRLQL